MLHKPREGYNRREGERDREWERERERMGRTNIGRERECFVAAEKKVLMFFQNLTTYWCFLLFDSTEKDFFHDTLSMCPRVYLCRFFFLIVQRVKNARAIHYLQYLHPT